MSVMTAKKGMPVMEKKIVSISSKRQITIPQKFYTALGFADEAECIVRDNELIIRPIRVQSGGEFAEQILAELIAEGLSGDALLMEFKNRQAKVRPAVESLIHEAENAAWGKGVYATEEDIFYEELKKYMK